jgi:hypothetical protein
VTPVQRTEEQERRKGERGGRERAERKGEESKAGGGEVDSTVAARALPEKESGAVL